METGSPSNSSSPNLEQLMQLGIQTARKGNKPNARMIFQQILDADKQNERAWLWMAAVSETPEDRFRYLRTVLRINPHNQTALRELKKMQQRRESSNSQALRYGLIGLVIILILIALGIIAVLLVS
jgi:GrpB-like predicted nucleotidyltransferase (UPF0157 family)